MSNFEKCLKRQGTQISKEHLESLEKDPQILANSPLQRNKIKQLFNAILIFCSCFCLNTASFAQKIPTHQAIPVNQLTDYLKEDIQKQLQKDGDVSQKVLAEYLRTKFSERYFYDWKNLEQRFETYQALYKGRQKTHAARAEDHLGKYTDSTQWVLPFNYLNGKPVNAYALRHLARQHKMIDIAFQYFYDNKDPKYIHYFTRQMMSLNVALEKQQYEKIKDGNGVFEAFRSGYRILNWLQIHHMFLGEVAYSDENQLTTIATLLQHGEHLYQKNAKFKSGNHQTRGMSALAMLSILLRDFEGTDRWYDRSMELLKQHLTKEINDDGFQFERSVHYHMSDIGNYYYVYQLAKISQMPIDAFWESRLKSLFTTLIKIAYPDKSAPVLQDDTEIPWGEKNDISKAMTLGYLLFEDPAVGYFANDEVAPKWYWYLNDAQLQLLNNVQKKKPTYPSIALPTTGYYIMREGWNSSDNVLVISNGLDDKKPDHQHGDMLGIQAMANGKVILPNYQVRYSLTDFDLFKNSMVKNVALVDDELQGKKWTSNKGGSGFGKFKSLPAPTNIAWETNNNFDYFVGSHDGFENVGVAYSRQVIYVKDDFWIVKDNFQSTEEHTYKQVWQGHYSTEQAPNLLRATFDDASGCDIFQLKEVTTSNSAGKRGKAWTVVEEEGVKDFDFLTIIFPYKGYSNRINEEETLDLKGWKINQSNWDVVGKEAVALSKDGATYFFGVTQLKQGEITLNFSAATDIFVSLKDKDLLLQHIGPSAVNIEMTGLKAVKMNDKLMTANQSLLAPNDKLIGQE